jgi:hypothetical protein
MFLFGTPQKKSGTRKFMQKKHDILESGREQRNLQLSTDTACVTFPSIFLFFYVPFSFRSCKTLFLFSRFAKNGNISRFNLFVQKRFPVCFAQTKECPDALVMVYVFLLD